MNPVKGGAHLLAEWAPPLSTPPGTYTESSETMEDNPQPGPTVTVRVITDLTIDVGAWQREYGSGNAAEVSEQATQDARDWATEAHYTEPKWQGLVVGKTVEVELR